jgi:hypothetical protein
VRARDQDGALLPHFGVALFFGTAVLIRPTAAVGTGLPILIAWIALVLRGPRELWAKRIAAFAFPAAATAALLLGINKIQNGSFFLVSYLREFQYAKENGLRFNNWSAYRDYIDVMDPHFSRRVDLVQALATAGSALLRINFNLFGWVPSFLFVPFAARRPGAALLGAMFAFFFVVHYGVDQAGIDTYGPHHYVEPTLPIVILSALGIDASAKWLRDRAREGETVRLELAPGALAAAFTIVALVGYEPSRARALLSIAGDVNGARDMVAKNELHRAVIFSPRPFTKHFARCGDETGHFVYWRPNNDPDLKNDILWVNHISLTEDAKLMSVFPDRTGYVYFFDPDCRRVLVPLDRAPPGSVPDGDVDGDNRGIVGARRRAR